MEVFLCLGGDFLLLILLSISLALLVTIISSETTLCRDNLDALNQVTAGDAIWRKWASYIDDKTDHELGAGERLSVIEGAKDDAIYMVRREGCKSDDVKELLALYDAELAAMAKR